MKFDGFDLDLTKITNGYGDNPLMDGCEDVSSGSASGSSAGGGSYPIPPTGFDCLTPQIGEGLLSLVTRCNG